MDVPPDSSPTPETKPTPGRRTVVRGAAWAAPLAVAGAAAPAYAASPMCGTRCPNIAFGTSVTNGSTNGGNGWTSNHTSFSWSNTNNLGFYGNSGGAVTGKGTNFAVAREPSSNRTVTLTQSGQVQFTSDCTYTVRYGVVTWASASSNNVTLQVRIGSQVVGSYSTAGQNESANIDRGFQTITFTPTSAGNLTFNFVLTSGDSDDVYVYQPSVVSCVNA